MSAKAPYGGDDENTRQGEEWRPERYGWLFSEFWGPWWGPWWPGAIAGVVWSPGPLLPPLTLSEHGVHTRHRPHSNENLSLDST